MGYGRKKSKSYERYCGSEQRKENNRTSRKRLVKK